MGVIWLWKPKSCNDFSLFLCTFPPSRRTTSCHLQLLPRETETAVEKNSFFFPCLPASFSASLPLFIFFSSTFPWLQLHAVNSGLFQLQHLELALQLIRCTWTSPCAAEWAPACKWLDVYDILLFFSVWPFCQLKQWNEKRELHDVGGATIGSGGWGEACQCMLFLYKKNSTRQENSKKLIISERPDDGGGVESV